MLTLQFVWLFGQSCGSSRPTKKFSCRNLCSFRVYEIICFWLVILTRSFLMLILASVFFNTNFKPYSSWENMPRVLCLYEVNFKNSQLSNFLNDIYSAITQILCQMAILTYRVILLPTTSIKNNQIIKLPFFSWYNCLM